MIDSEIGLLILQPTPFCNIDCSYCYLPDREVRSRMSLATFTKIMERLVESRWLGEKISFVWHAGEPLALPVDYYAELFDRIDSFPALRGKVVHNIQTNGIPINDDWCRLFQKHGVSVGLSLDGPEFLHDRFRRDRRGGGTLARALKGVECLRRNHIDFHVIAVLTSYSLDFADEIFQFFLDLGVTNLGFNIEEKEGVNTSSSLESDDVDQRVASFLRRTYELQRQNNNRLKIREFDHAFRAIGQSDLEVPEETTRLNDQTTAVRILSIDHAGNFSTFSPELMGMGAPKYGDFVFGNVHLDSFDSIWSRPNFVATAAEIDLGVKQCQASCEYFALCGGGAPSNKLYENGSFASTETMYCRYTIKYPIDIVLSELERELELSPY